MWFVKPASIAGVISEAGLPSPVTLPKVSLETELDAIIAQSLGSFYQVISGDWWGRENEMVNLYAFCCLAGCVKPNTIFYDIGQIGIEVTVRQLPPNEQHKGRRGTVRKDLVIWEKPGMTLWEKKLPDNEPVAVMEWKVNHFLNRRKHQKNRDEYRGDIDWLRETSARVKMEGFVGYAVMVEHTQQPKPTLTCARVHGGSVNEQFVHLPKSADEIAEQKANGLPLA